MGGFKKFLLRGNLVELAVAVVIGAVSAAVAAPTTNCSRPRARPSLISSGKPSSRIGTSPFFRRATRSAHAPGIRHYCGMSTTMQPSMAVQTLCDEPTRSR